MLLILSPSKRLADAAAAPEGAHSTSPRLLAEAATLVDRLRRFDPDGLAHIYGVSERLAELNHARFRDWSGDRHTAGDATPAALLFRGDVYDGLRAWDWPADAYVFAQSHLRILSGQYGVLRPLDLILPHRLEMGTKFPRATRAVPRTLYDYWGDRLSGLLRDDLTGSDGGGWVLDLASREYAKAAPLPDVRTVTPRFLTDRPGGPPRVVAVHAKQARGRLARWVVSHRLTNPDRLPEWDEARFRFAPDLSEPYAPAFVRPAT